MKKVFIFMLGVFILTGCEMNEFETKNTRKNVEDFENFENKDNDNDNNDLPVSNQTGKNSKDEDINNCKKDSDCPIITCVKEPCSKYKCEDEKCNLLKQNNNQNLCEMKVVFKGQCEMFISGVNFDKEQNKCVEVSGSGCSAEIPFKNLEECQEMCVSS